MIVFKRKLGGIESENYYYKFQFGGKQYLRCANTRNERLAKREAAQHLERLRAERAKLEEVAKLAGCKPQDVRYCEQCRKPMSRVRCLYVGHAPFCGKDCYRKWRDARQVVAVPTLREFERRFMKSVETHSFDKPATIQFYKLKYTRLLEFGPLADTRLDRIDEGLIDSYVQHRRKVVSPASTNRELATLRKALRLAYDWKLLDRVPRIRLLPGEKPREFVLSHQQEAAYLENAPEPLKSVALLLVDTGLRISEALALQWSDVHLEHNFLHVRSGKSRNATRDVLLTTRVQAMLETRCAARRSPWVFTDEPGTGPLSIWTLQSQHKRVRLALGLSPMVLHSLRHTFATRLGESGAGAFEIKKLLGHSSVTVSERYTHPTAEMMQRAFDRLQALNESKQRALPSKGQTETQPRIKTVSHAA